MYKESNIETRTCNNSHSKRKMIINNVGCCSANLSRRKAHAQYFFPSRSLSEGTISFSS